MEKIIIGDEILPEGEEAVITAWLVEPGDLVDEGDVIAELMLAKVQMEIESPYKGEITPLIDPEVPVRLGTVIAHVRAEND